MIISTYKNDPHAVMCNYISICQNWIKDNIITLYHIFGQEYSDEFTQLKTTPVVIDTLMSKINRDESIAHIKKLKLVDNRFITHAEYKDWCLAYIKICHHFIGDNYKKLIQFVNSDLLDTNLLQLLKLEEELETIFNTENKVDINLLFKNLNLICCSKCHNCRKKPLIAVKCCQERQICASCLYNYCSCAEPKCSSCLTTAYRYCDACHTILCRQFKHDNFCYSCHIKHIVGVWNPTDFKRCQQRVQNEIRLMLLILKRYSTVWVIPPKFVRHKIFYSLL